MVTFHGYELYSLFQGFFHHGVAPCAAPFQGVLLCCSVAHAVHLGFLVLLDGFQSSHFLFTGINPHHMPISASAVSGVYHIYANLILPKKKKKICIIDISFDKNDWSRF